MGQRHGFEEETGRQRKTGAGEAQVGVVGVNSHQHVSIAQNHQQRGN